MTHSAENGALARLAQAGHAHAIVSELTRDPDPRPTHQYEADPASGAGNCRCGGRGSGSRVNSDTMACA